MAIKDNLFDEEKIRAHIRKTIQEYLKTLKEASIKDLNKNIIDPIKLTFDKNVFNLTMDTLIANELLRQNDKTISNIIGYFNQNLFKFINVEGWEVPKNGFDIVNNEQKIYVEMKNKHNTVNANAKTAIFSKMLEVVEKDELATCILVEVISKKSQDEIWKVNGTSHPQIRRMSIDKFMTTISGDEYSFYKTVDLIKKLIVEETEKMNKSNPDFNVSKIASNIVKEIKEIAKADNVSEMDVLFGIAFPTYVGFKK
jgi:hypothetical protein